jgi:hypothetical protein
VPHGPDAVFAFSGMLMKQRCLCFVHDFTSSGLVTIPKSSTEDESPVDGSQKCKFSVRTSLKKSQNGRKVSPLHMVRLLAQPPCHHLSEWLDDKLGCQT